MKKQIISVITPVYNGERFIESCIKSVIDQNCPNAEHIIIDGGSTDKTVDIVKKYAEQYSHIRWLSERDRGQSDAMNKGVDMAKGEILSFLNVDDYYEPNVLNRVLEIFKDLPKPSFVCGNCNVWDDENNLVHFNQPQNLNYLDFLMADYKPITFPTNPSAYFYHKSLHQKTGIYNINEHYVLDIDFILRAVEMAHTKYVNETWGNYRYIKGTKTHNDYQSDAGYQRLLHLLAKYRNQLTLIKKIQLKCLIFQTKFKSLLSQIKRKITRRCKSKTAS